MLNVDVVTLFDPALVDELRRIEEQCESCLTRLTGEENTDTHVASSTTLAMDQN